MIAQMTLTETQPWWMWATVAVLIGSAAGITVTQAVKTWRKDHKNRPMMDSECRLWGRAASAATTACSWLVISIQTGQVATMYSLAVALAVLSAMLAPFIWENAISLLRVVKPEWAKRLSGQ